jgi:Isopropylmalate/homocitrate/citramalate synthases
MFEHLPASVKVVEVGPRDGLQNEPEHVSTANKVKLIYALAEAGISHIEVSSFVSPKWIPQLADAMEVATALHPPHLSDSVTTSALVPNIKGYERFKESGLHQPAFFMSATESHSKKNINKSVDEAIDALKEVLAAAKGDGYKVRCYLSVVFECPYEGSVSPDQVLRVTEKLVKLGVDEISLGDTIGAATPNQVIAIVNRVKEHIAVEKLALHFHDTRGTALANVVAGLEAGVTIFDASLGGMGGCPYAPGAAGNLATEDLVYMLHGLGVKTGIDLDKLVDAGALAQQILGKELPGRYLKASLAKRAKECAA